MQGVWMDEPHQLERCVGSGYLKKSAPFSNETYGEIKPSFVSQIVERLQIGSEDVFYDLGSGK